MSPRALSLGITSLPARAKQRIESVLGGAVRWLDRPDLDQLDEHASELKFLLVSLPVRIDADTFKRLPKLRYVGVFGTSVSNIDMEAAAASGVKVANVQHYCDPETAEFTTGLVIGGLRGIFLDNPGTQSLQDSRVGIVGLGQVGSILAAQLEELGVEVIPFRRDDGDRRARLQRCHAVCICGPRDVQVFGPEDFAALPPGAGLVNTSNGTLLDDSAFRSWLARGGGWVAMDRVAARTYGYAAELLGPRAFIAQRSAYRTPRAMDNLVEHFVGAVETFCGVTQTGSDRALLEFAQRVLRTQKVWSLRGDRWARADLGTEIEALPFWATRQAADRCVGGSGERWEEHEARSIELQEFVLHWLTGMVEDGIVVTLDPTPDSIGTVVEPQQLLDALQT